MINLSPTDCFMLVLAYIGMRVWITIELHEKENTNVKR